MGGAVAVSDAVCVELEDGDFRDPQQTMLFVSVELVKHRKESSILSLLLCFSVSCHV